MTSATHPKHYLFSWDSYLVMKKEEVIDVDRPPCAVAIDFPGRGPSNLRGFTQEHFENELTAWHVKVPEGKLPSDVYATLPLYNKKNPKTGVFRDYQEYGVYPAFVTIQRVKVTIPLIASFLSSRQTELEIVNQHNEGRQGAKDAPVEQSVLDEMFGDVPGVKKITLQGDYINLDDPFGARVPVILRSPPTPDLAFMLIKELKNLQVKCFGTETDERCRGAVGYVPYTKPLQLIMSAINLLYYLSEDISPSAELISAFTPTREEILFELYPVIPRNVTVKEYNQWVLRDPNEWGSVAIESLTMATTVDLLQTLITQKALSSQMRGIIDWYKGAFTRRRFYDLIRGILQSRDRHIPTVYLRKTMEEGRRLAVIRRTPKDKEPKK